MKTLAEKLLGESVEEVTDAEFKKTQERQKYQKGKYGWW